MDKEAGKSFSRRDFLRIAIATSGLAAASTLLEACSSQQTSAPATSTGKPAHSAATSSPATAAGLGETQDAAPTSSPQATETAEPTPEASPTPTEIAMAGVGQVAFVKTDDRVEGVRKAIELLGIKPVAGKRVFLKPNYNSADPTPGSTHPDVLRTLVRQLQEMGAAAITVGDRSGMGATRAVMRSLGVFELAEELGFETLVFDELGSGGWEMRQVPGGYWKQGFPFARPCLESDAMVQACCLKTHRYGGVFTLSLKNSVGMVAKLYRGYDYMNELHTSSHQRKMIAEINTAYTPALIVLDGVEAFVSGGPATGKLASPGVVLAGTDRVAIDAVGAALLRQHGAALESGSVFEQQQIARAVELGLGVDSPEKIEFVTPDGESAAYAEQVREVLLP